MGNAQLRWTGTALQRSALVGLAVKPRSGTAEDMRLLALLLTVLMAAFTMAVPMEIAAKSADYAKYSHLQGPTYYAKTEIGPPVPLQQAQSRGW